LVVTFSEENRAYGFAGTRGKRVRRQAASFVYKRNFEGFEKHFKKYRQMINLANLEQDHESFICIAIHSNKSCYAKFFAENGSPVNKEFRPRYAYRSSSRTPLKCAIDQGNKDVAKYLIAKGANTSIKVNDPSFLQEVLDELDSSGSESIPSTTSCIDKFSNQEEATEALFNAISNNDINDFEFAMKHGADVNAKNYYKNSPLAKALSKCNPQIITRLIESGANITEVFSGNENLLFTSLRRKCNDGLRIITQSDAFKAIENLDEFVNTTRFDGFGLVMLAIVDKNFEALKILLSPEILEKLESPDTYIESFHRRKNELRGNKSLTIAAINNDIEAVKLLTSPDILDEYILDFNGFLSPSYNRKDDIEFETFSHVEAAMERNL